MTTESTATAGLAASAASIPPRHVVTMHDDVPLWCDTCCCEPEPRWQRVAEELGLDDDADTVAEAHRRVANTTRSTD